MLIISDIFYSNGGMPNKINCVQDNISFAILIVSLLLWELFVSGLPISFCQKNLLVRKSWHYWFVTGEYGHLILYIHIFWSNTNNIKFTIQSIQVNEICIFTTLCNHLYSHSKINLSFPKKALYPLISDSLFPSILIP